MQLSRAAGALRLLTVGASAMLLAATAHADTAMQTIGKAWSCARDVTVGNVQIAASVLEKGAQVAEIGANAAACTAATGSPAPYGVTLAAISALKVASPAQVPTGQCAPAVKGLLAKPFAEGISYIMPPGSIKNALLNLVNSSTVKDALWDAVNAIPGVQPYTMQVDCACTTIDNGIALTDLQDVTDAVNQASASCASMLDSLGLGFINRLDDTLKDGLDAAYAGISGFYDEVFNGETDPNPPHMVYEGYFASQRGIWIDRVSTQGGRMEVIAGEVEVQREACARYYDKHKHSLANGNTICDGMRDRILAEVRPVAHSNWLEHQVLTAVQARWILRYPQNWEWRLPAVQTGVMVGVTNRAQALATFRSTPQDALGKHPYWQELFDLGGRLTCSSPSYMANARWRCQATGIYAAARQTIAQVREIEPAINAAVAGASGALAARLIERWDQNRTSVRNYYLWWWRGTPPAFAGKFGCPANDPWNTACIKDLEASFDQGCYVGLRDAVAYAPSAASAIFGPIAGQIGACQELLQRRVALSMQLSNRALDQSPQSAADLICQAYPARSDQLNACNAILIEAYDSCAVKTIEAGYSVATDGHFKSCWAPAKANIQANLANLVAVRLAQGTRVTPTVPAPTGPITAPNNPVLIPPVQPQPAGRPARGG